MNQHERYRTDIEKAASMLTYDQLVAAQDHGARLFRLLAILVDEVGSTGWQNASPLISERKARAELLTEVQALLQKVRTS